MGVDFKDQGLRSSAMLSLFPVAGEALLDGQKDLGWVWLLTLIEAFVSFHIGEFMCEMKPNVLTESVEYSIFHP